MNYTIHGYMYFKSVRMTRYQVGTLLPPEVVLVKTTPHDEFAHGLHLESLPHLTIGKPHNYLVRSTVKKRIYQSVCHSIYEEQSLPHFVYQFRKRRCKLTSDATPDDFVNSALKDGFTDEGLLMDRPETANSM